MIKNKNVLPPRSDFWEGRGRTRVIALILGTAIVAAPIFLGKSYAFFIPFIVFSFFMTMLWRKSPRPWMSLFSVSAATPIPITRYSFAGNVLFALWFIVFNTGYLFKIPKWIYVSAALAVLGIFTSSVNWMPGDVAQNTMRQVTFGFNMYLAPFLLLPAVYLRMRESNDYDANLRGLLFCLIVPSTVLLTSAKLFGSVSNVWEASQHASMLSDGFLVYQLGRLYVNFLRTEVGFILAALICASGAILFSQVKTKYRLLAGACFIANVFLLLTTGSFGSSSACLCGLAVIFFTMIRKVSLMKVLASVFILCSILVLSYGLAPPSTKKYLEKRFEHRVTKADTDRLALWSNAADHLMMHPEGVGFTMRAGNSFIHNDYLAYAVSYGLIGGLGYVYLVVGLLIYFFRVPRSTFSDSSALAVHLAGLGVLVALAINSMTDHSNENRWYFNVIWSIIWYSYFCGSATQGKTAEKGFKDVCC